MTDIPCQSVWLLCRCESKLASRSHLLRHIQVERFPGSAATVPVEITTPPPKLAGVLTPTSPPAPVLSSPPEHLTHMKRQ